jgi:hypothetical protein
MMFVHEYEMNVYQYVRRFNTSSKRLTKPLKTKTQSKFFAQVRILTL